MIENTSNKMFTLDMKFKTENSKMWKYQWLLFKICKCQWEKWMINADTSNLKWKKNLVMDNLQDIWNNLF